MSNILPAAPEADDVASIRQWAQDLMQVLILERQAADAGDGGGASSASLPPVGAMMPYLGLAPPGGNWLPCEGQVLLRADYPDLFDAISTSFNTGGETSTQFRLPNGAGRYFKGYQVGDGAYYVGRTEFTITKSNLPNYAMYDGGHTHSSWPGALRVEGGNFFSPVFISVAAGGDYSIPKPQISPLSDLAFPTASTITSVLLGGSDVPIALNPLAINGQWIIRVK
jgi:hypothetical protein